VRPLGGALLRAQQALGVPHAPEARAWRPTAATPFERDAFDAMYFAPVQRARTSAGEVALGRALFFDPVLSRDGARACASCHEPARGFAHGRARSLPGAGSGPASRRNAPTVLNAALQNASFHDLRAVSLEDQITAVVGNREEMHGSLAGAAAHVAARPAYARAFAATYGAPDERAVTAERVRAALAAYLRTLVRLDAPFDRAARGERGALSDEARRGFTVFMGKGKCGTCHFAPLFNGSVPPLYQETESEVLGVPARAAWRRATVDPDPGRMAATGLPIHRHAFKTPTLRNVALTAPYMHNGVYRTLAEVVEFYDRGGGAGIGIALPNQTLPPEPLRLTRSEKGELIAFLHALTDTATVRTTATRPRDVATAPR
jgi:cytochrome c peroxidase